MHRRESELCWLLSTAHITDIRIAGGPFTQAQRQRSFALAFKTGRPQDRTRSSSRPVMSADPWPQSPVCMLTSIVYSAGATGQCPAGAFTEPSNNTCISCAPGSASPQPGASSCQYCQPGYYAPQPATVTCYSCPQVRRPSPCASFIHSFITRFPIRRSGALQQTFYGSPPACPVLGFSPPCV